jgi:type II secretory pathway pseudopilin PulG
MFDVRHSSPSGAVHRRRETGFTMVEIALCLAIIGFALVAIIGVLPTGLTVQRDNREETIINQEAKVWMDAIQNGARGYDDLTNYVVGITNYWSYWNTPSTVERSGIDSYTPTDSLVTSSSTVLDFRLTSGFRIIGLLSAPKYDPSAGYPFSSNYVVAHVRAMSGSAVDKPGQRDAEMLAGAFAYRLIVEISPHLPFDTNLICVKLRGAADPFSPALTDIGDLTNTFPGPPATAADRKVYWDRVRQNRREMANAFANTHDVRLTFRWPILPNGGVGNMRRTFRLFTGGVLVPIADPVEPDQILHFLEPGTYVQIQ